MKFVIRRTALSGVWVADAKHRGIPSYTRDLSRARVFTDRGQAEAVAAPEAERVVSVRSIASRGST